MYIVTQIFCHRFTLTRGIKRTLINLHVLSCNFQLVCISNKYSTYCDHCGIVVGGVVVRVVICVKKKLESYKRPVLVTAGGAIVSDFSYSSTHSCSFTHCLLQDTEYSMYSTLKGSFGNNQSLFLSGVQLNKRQNTAKLFTSVFIMKGIK